MLSAPDVQTILVLAPQRWVGAAGLLAALEAGLPAKNAPAYLDRLTVAVRAVTAS